MRRRSTGRFESRVPSAHPLRNVTICIQGKGSLARRARETDRRQGTRAILAQGVQKFHEQITSPHSGTHICLSLCAQRIYARSFVMSIPSGGNTIKDKKVAVEKREFSVNFPYAELQWKRGFVGHCRWARNVARWSRGIFFNDFIFISRIFVF